MSVPEPSNLKAMKKQRATVKAQITRIITYVNDTDNLDVFELQARRARLFELRDLFENVQNVIENEEESEDHISVREQFEKQVFSAVALLEKNIKALELVSKSNSAGSSIDSATNVTVKQTNTLLPKIEIKPFDGNPIEWHSFHDSFKSLVHENTDLLAVQKFHLLKNSLRGEVACLLSALNASEANYTVAWDLLQKRCNKPRQIINSHLKLLLELPEISRDSSTNLRILAEQAQMHVDALKTAKQPVEHWDTILVYLISKKLDKNTRRAWERTLENEAIPKFTELINFINKQARGDETESESLLSSSYNTRNKVNKRVQNYVATATKNSCFICKEGHELFNCPRFLKMSVRERFNEVRRMRFCLKCLRKHYDMYNCTYKNCVKCGRKHNTLLHFPTTQVVPKVEESLSNSSSNNGSEKTVLTVTNNSEVLLGTARVKILDKFNKEHVCRVLLDGASQAHFITKRLANRLQLRQEKLNFNLSGISQIKTHADSFVSATIKSICTSYSTKVKCVSVDNISGLLPARFINKNNIKIPKNIQLADPDFYKPAEVDLLLGNTVFYNLLTSGQISLCDDRILLQSTKLGWIVTGESNWERASCYSVQKYCFLSLSLDEQLNKFWEIEEITDKVPLSSEEVTCEQHFADNTARDNSGRYIVKLPFNSKINTLGESRNAALNRFFALERRLHRDSNLWNQYSEFLREYEALGHMTKIENDNISSGYYLPHHAVFKESSNTTKIRVVFDASAKTSTGVSLNDILLVGPTIQDSLYSILLRFRTHRFVLTADIEKMFRQIQLHADDRQYQKIFWRTSPDQPVETYKLNTVTYGTASAPFLAVRCLRQLADDESDKFPLAAKIYKRDFYVDDVLTGASDFESALKLRNELIGLSKLGGFNLRQWASNDVNLIKDLDISLDQGAICLHPDDNKKMLGVYWNPSSDNIFYVIKSFNDDECVTKRSILSRIAQLFDPLGLLGPVIIRAKIIMQSLWKANIGWDQSVPEELGTMWSAYQDELHVLNKFVVNRRLTIDNAVDFQLHGFSDASESAYGACIFIRSTNKEGSHKVALLCAKSRVAPVKTVSLPRLELCAARLLAKLYNEVKLSLSNIQFSSIRFWSDSTIVLHWLKTPPHTLKVFVANRVNEIQTLTDPHSWFHVSSLDNPADCISRGQSPIQFLQNSMWLNGPRWLATDEILWPINELSEIDIPERRNIICLTTNKEIDSLFENFSSIYTLNRVIAYLLRFCHNTRNTERRVGPLTTQEIKDAHLRILQLIQGQNFALDIRNLKRNKVLNKNSKLLNLNPFIDDLGILRVGGRLKYADINYSQKYPILLPRSHHVTNLIIQYEHIRHWHAGVSATLNALRQRYWPIDARNNIKRIIHKCMRCYRTNPRTLAYLMGNLPKSRVVQVRPFQNVGIDYCGPFMIKEKKFRNKTNLKAYVAVFVCFATKAVHLELVTDLTSEACLGAIKRFFARRGKAHNIYSDNGTNFVGVKNELIKIQVFLESREYKDKIYNFATKENISWHFSPPRSPHFGGLWEAAVKAFKRHLFKTVGDATFTFEQFYTLITEIEAILNSRPIIPISSDPNDFTALTPGHFLIGDSLTNLPEHDLSTLPVNRLSLWQHIQKIKGHFWTRWSKDYLSELHTRSKWHINNANIREGTLVLIQEDNIPPMQWKLGRIVSLHPGEDQIVRVATVRTAYGIYKRAINKLSPLPIDNCVTE